MLCHQKIGCTFVAALVLLCFGPEVQAESISIVAYDINVAGTTTTPQPASTVAANVTAGNFAPYLDGALSTSTNAVNGMAFSGTGDDGYLGFGTITSAPGNDYWSFTVEADTGFLIEFDTLTFDFKAAQFTSGTGQCVWDVRSSVDFHASSLGSHSSGVNGEIGAASIDISSLGTQSGQVEFRIYNYKSGTFGNPGSQMRVDNVTINGAVIPNAIPEPGTLALLGMALLGLGWYAWRKRR